jgi:hypothetical protein
MFSAEIFEELTGHRSGWSPDEYERWLAERLFRDAPPTGPRASLSASLLLYSRA